MIQQENCLSMKIPSATEKFPFPVDFIAHVNQEQLFDNLELVRETCVPPSIDATLRLH